MAQGIARESAKLEAEGSNPSFPTRPMVDGGLRIGDCGLKDITFGILNPTIRNPPSNAGVV